MDAKEVPLKTKVGLMLVLICFGLVSLLSGAERTKYPAPRFPSYLRPPKSIDDVMPYARAAVRQTGELSVVCHGSSGF